MGQSTDGILAFGVDFGEDIEMPWGDDFEEYLHEEASLIWKSGMSDEESSKYFAACRKVEAACPVEVVIHCSLDYPMYILAVRGTHTSASRGYPEAIDPKELIVQEEKIAAAKAWCEKLDIQWDNPQWLLCSLWG